LLWSYRCLFVMSEDYVEATAEQKLNIATYFIMSSPSGEVDEVVSDVQKLVSDPSVLTDSALLSILREYNTEQMISAPDLSTPPKPLLISKYGAVGTDLYLDPATGKVLQFDHRKRVFVSETDKRQVLRDDVDSYRAALSTALTTYLSTAFKPNKYAAAVYGADNGTVTLCISAKNVNLGNFWTGSWRAVYTLNVLQQSTELKGNVKIDVHYFEDGNVQLHTAVDMSTVTVNIDAPDAVSKRVIEALNKFETDYQNELEEMYVNMHRTTFKAMRRFLPVNRQKFLWNAAAHSLAQEVSK